VTTPLLFSRGGGFDQNGSGIWRQAEDGSHSSTGNPGFLYDKVKCGKFLGTNYFRALPALSWLIFAK